MGDLEIHRFSRSGSFIVPGRASSSPTNIEARRGDFFLRPLRRFHRYGLIATDPPVVMPVSDYAGCIVAAVYSLLATSETPSTEMDAYKEPGLSLSGYSARLESLPDGSMSLTSMRGTCSPRDREPFNGHVPNESVATDLPRAILEAIGERPEDIRTILNPRRVPSNKRM